MVSDYINRESRTFIEIADDLNDLVTELNDKIAETIREKNAFAKNADVAPVRHGRWIDKIYGCKECSECGYIWLDFGCPNYCPKCGARMDGEGDDTD